MASGILGQYTLQANTDTVVYTVPAAKITTCSINIVNRNVNTATLRIALSSTSSPSNSEFLEYGATLNQSGVLERTGIVLDAGKNIIVYSDVVDVTVNVYGFED